MSMGNILTADKDGVYILKFIGDVRLNLCSALDAFLDEMFQNPVFETVLIDLTETEGIDSTSLGLLAKISIQAKKKFDLVPTIISVNEDITRILLSMGFDDVFMIVQEPIMTHDDLSQLPTGPTSESDMQRKVLEAHKYLMGMNEQNHETFKELVNALEESSRLK